MQKVVQRSLLDFLQTRFGLFLLVCGAFWCLNTVIGLLQLLITTSTSPLCPHCSQHNYADALGSEGDGYNLPRPGSLIAPNQISYENTLCYPPIDIVYTWVNGSDPRTIRDLAYWKSVESGDQAAAALATALRVVNSTLGNGNSTEFTDKGDQMSNNRFRDNQELRYSLRSIWKFAPWIRHVFIVTNGHVPYWLNLDHPRVTLISHADIFPNASHLPTFSSPAIEAHLHRIPGIAEKFIYFNDDVMLGNAITPDDFYTHGQGQKVFLSWNVPNCAPGCPDTWLADRYCDSACNNADCNWDMGDCLNSTSTGGSGGTKDRYGNWENSRGGSGNAAASSSNARYCSTGCPNNWVGDKVCDRACKNAECAYDGGDCGVDLMRETLPSIQLPFIPPNSQPVLPVFTVPYGTTALFVNLSAAFPGTIVDASHDASSVVRSAIVTQNLKVLTLILYDEADIAAPAAPETSGNETEASTDETFTEPPFRRIEIFLQGEHQGFLTNVTFNVTRSRFPSAEQLAEAARALEEGSAPAIPSKDGGKIVTDPDAMFAGLNAARAAAEAASGSTASAAASSSSSQPVDDSADAAAAAEVDPAAHAEDSEDAMIPSTPGGRRLLSSFDSLVQTIRHALHRDQQGATVAPPSPHPHSGVDLTPAPRTKPTSEMTREELDAPFKPAAGYHTRAYASAPSAATPHSSAHSSYHASTYSKSTYPAPLYDRWQDVPVFIDGVPLEADMQRSGVKLREAVDAHENLWMRRDDASTAAASGSVLTDAAGQVLESYGWTQSDYELAARIRAHKQKQLWLLERETARENFLSAWRESQREKRRLLEGKWEEVFEEEMQRSHAAAAEAARRAGGSVSSDFSHDSTASAAVSRRPRINRDPVWPWELEVAAPSLFEDWDWSVEAARFSKNQASIRRLMRKVKRKLAAAAAGSEFDGFEFERYDSGSSSSSSGSSSNDDSERIGYGEGVNDDGSVEIDMSGGQGLFGGAAGVVSSPSAPAINLAQLGSNIPSAASFSSSLVAPSSVVTTTTEEDSHSHESHADVSIATNAGPRRQLMDLYGDSLRFVNSLYTAEFGKEQRKAPAHMPHMIDVSIERELQSRWPHLFDATSAHRFRHSHDMQYSFSYFYYLMNVPREFNLQQVWDEQLDLNHDGLLDPIEIRYLTLWLSGKKILPRDLVKMNEKLLNVTKTIHGYAHNYYEPTDPPRIDMDVIRYSGDILDLIEDKWTSLRKFKFELVNLEQIEFYMVPDNTSKVQLRLDEIRSKMPKFICLNDDMNKTADPPAATLQVLKDFYTSYFPLPCPFENADSKPNDFMYIEDYRERKRAGGLSNLVQKFNSYFATLVPASSSADSLPLANGTHAKRHGIPPLLLVSLFVTLLVLILIVAQQLGLFQKCRSKQNLKNKGGHAS